MLAIRRSARLLAMIGVGGWVVGVPSLLTAQQRGNMTAGMVDTSAISIALDSLLRQHVIGAIDVSAASKYSQTLSEAPGSITVITADEIERAGWRSMGQILATVRSFYVTSDHGYDYVGVRGFGRLNDFNNSILLLINGHTINDPVYGSALMGSDLAIDPRGIDHIEIVRGPGSALYGTGAVYGIVNVVLKSGATLDGVTIGALVGTQGRRGLRVQAGTGRPDAQISVHALLDERDGDTHLFLPQLNTPGNANGLAVDRDFEKRASVAVMATLGHFSFSSLLLDRIKAFPLPYYDTLLTSPGAIYHDTFLNGDLRYTNDLSPKVHLFARGYADQYWYTTRPGTRDSTGSALETATGTVAGTEANVGWDLSSNVRLTGGGEYRRTFRARTEGIVDQPYVVSMPYSVASGYAQADWQPTAKLSVLGALRHDEYSRSGSNTAPRLAISWATTRWYTIKFLYGQSYRAPSIFELAGDGFSVLPNMTLRPTRITTTEIASTYAIGRSITVNTAVYSYVVHGLIGDSTVDANAGTSINTSIADARGLGAEVELLLRTPSGIGGYLKYAYADAEMRPSGLQLDNAPHHVGQAGLNTQLDAGFIGALEAQAISSRQSWDGSVVPGSFLTNAHIAYQPRTAVGARRNWELSVRVQNLFNRKAYGPVASFVAPVTSVSQYGRSISLQLRVHP